MLHFLFPTTKHFSEKNLEVGTGERRLSDAPFVPTDAGSQRLHSVSNHL